MIHRLSDRYMESNAVAFFIFSYLMWGEKILRAYRIAPKKVRARYARQTSAGAW